MLQQPEARTLHVEYFPLRRREMSDPEREWEQIIKKATLTADDELGLAAALLNYWADKDDGPQFNGESLLLLRVYEALQGSKVHTWSAAALYYPSSGSA